MRLSDYTKEELVSYILSEGENSNYWTFMSEWPTKKSDLVREVITFANTSHDEDCYLICGVSESLELIGITNEGFTTSEIQSWLLDLPWAGEFVPRIAVETVMIQGKLLAILTVYNTYRTPIFLTENYGEMLAGCIYTRRSVSCKESASYQEIEQLWKKHFGLTKPTLECIIDRLHDKDEWRISGTSYYNLYHPEYRLNENEMIFDGSDYDYYCYAQSNQSTYYSNIDITDENTVLKTYQLVHLGGGHLSVPIPEWGFISTLRSSEKLAYNYYVKGTNRYQLLEFMYDAENLAEQAAYCDFMKVVLVYQSLEEKQAFEDYIEFVGKSVCNMISENTEFSHLATGNTARNTDYKHKLRTGLVLNEILTEWRGDNELASDELYFNVSGTDARGIEREDESFIVYAGSKISPDIKESCSLANLKLRQEYNHIINEDFELQEDLLFPSPSAASSFITGSVTNGRLGWRREDGITLKSIQEYNKKAKEIQLDLKLW